MIKIKVKTILSEASATRKFSPSQSANFGIVSIIFKNYGFIVSNYLGGGQFSKVYSLEPIDPTRYEGMGRQTFIGKLSGNPNEYYQYERAKEVKNQVKNDPNHPEYADHLPTVYVAESINAGGFQSVIITERLQKLDPNVQQLLYGGADVGMGIPYNEDYPVRLKIVIEKLIKLQNMKEPINNIFNNLIENMKYQVDRQDIKAVSLISYDNFYDFLEASQYKQDENLINKISMSITGQSYDTYKKDIKEFLTNQKLYDKKQLMNLGKEALKGICLKHAASFYKYIELQNIKSIDDFVLNYIATSFYNSLFIMATEEPMPTHHKNISIASGFMNKEEPVKSFIEALDYIAKNYQYVYNDLHEENVMMREDKTLVASDLGMFKNF